MDAGTGSSARRACSRGPGAGGPGAGGPGARGPGARGPRKAEASRAACQALGVCAHSALEPRSCHRLPAPAPLPEPHSGREPGACAGETGRERVAVPAAWGRPENPSPRLHPCPRPVLSLPFLGGSAPAQHPHPVPSPARHTLFLSPEAFFGAGLARPKQDTWSGNFQRRQQCGLCTQSRVSASRSVSRAGAPAFRSPNPNTGFGTWSR